MTNRRVLATAFGAVFVVLVSPVTADDALDRRMLAMSPDARDCGTTDPAGADRAKVLECVEAQVAAGTPFRVRFDGTCIDAICAWGLMREKQDGPIRLVPYDPKLCPPAVPNESDPWCGTFAGVPCKHPNVVVKGKTLRVDCEGYVF